MTWTALLTAALTVRADVKLAAATPMGSDRRSSVLDSTNRNVTGTGELQPSPSRPRIDPAVRLPIKAPVSGIPAALACRTSFAGFVPPPSVIAPPKRAVKFEDGSKTLY